MEETKILRLITGEDIICGLHKISTESYAIIDPMLLIVKYKGKNSSVIMEHWLPIEVIKSNEVLMHPRDVITMFDPNEGLTEYYSNLVYKLHKSLESKSKLNDIQDLDEMIDIMEALEESQNQILH